MATLPLGSSVRIEYVFVSFNEFNSKSIALSQLGASSYMASLSEIYLIGSTGLLMSIIDALNTTTLEKTFFFKTYYDLLSTILLLLLLIFLLAYEVLI
jgi:hypothetical protein